MKFRRSDSHIIDTPVWHNAEFVHSSDWFRSVLLTSQHGRKPVKYMQCSWQVWHFLKCVGNNYACLVTLVFWEICLNEHAKEDAVKDDQPVSFRSELFASYILTNFTFWSCETHFRGYDKLPKVIHACIHITKQMNWLKKCVPQIRLWPIASKLLNSLTTIVTIS